MGFYTGTIGDSIKKSFNGSYLLNVILLLIVSLVLSAASCLIVLIPAVIAFIALQFSLTGIIIYLFSLSDKPLKVNL